MHALGPRWNGTILRYDASVQAIELQVSGTAATGRVYETLHVVWIPTPKTETPEELALRQAYPDKFSSTAAPGPSGEIDSYVGIRHEVTLERDAQGWRIVRDSYEEPELFGASPDLVPGSWSAVGTPSAMPAATPAG